MKKLISTVLAAALTLSLAACGSTAASSTSEAASGSEAASTASSETASDASDAVDFTGDGYDAAVDYASLAGTTIKVAASPVPHAEILKVAGDILAKADITLDVVEYTDYVQPNLVTESGEVDANYFQHGPYLEDFNEKNNTHLVSVAAIHYEPLGLYPGKTKELKDLQDGATVAVPNDATNEARALLLLQDAGLIKLKKNFDSASGNTNDIVSNPKKFKFKLIDDTTGPRIIKSVDAVLIGNTIALAGNLNVLKDSLYHEKIDQSTKNNINVLATAKKNKNNAAYKKLGKLYHNKQIQKWIAKKYSGTKVEVNKPVSYLTD